MSEKKLTLEQHQRNSRFLEAIKRKGYNGYKISKEVKEISQAKLTHLRSGRNCVSDKMIDALLSFFPDINRTWLLTGEGEAPTEESSNIQEKPQGDIIQASQGRFPRRKKEGLVAYYDVDFAAGNIEMYSDNSTVPTYYMDIPEFSGCTAFRAYSNSMENLIKSGSMLFADKIDAWFDYLEYGQIYAVVCKDGRRFLKYIRKHDPNPEEYFLLRSENSGYDDFEMPKRFIHSMWLIYGWVNKRV